jgi:hypothetical protein
VAPIARGASTRNLCDLAKRGGLCQKLHLRFTASKNLFGIGLKICYLIKTSIMGSLKKRRKAKINKHKRRKKLRLNRHKKRTWQK